MIYQKNIVPLMSQVHEILEGSENTLKSVRSAVHFMIRKNEQMQFILRLRETDKINALVCAHRLDIYFLLSCFIQKKISYYKAYMHELNAALVEYRLKVNKIKKV